MGDVPPSQALLPGAVATEVLAIFPIDKVKIKVTKGKGLV
jgi:hypothetical protein